MADLDDRRKRGTVILPERRLAYWCELVPDVMEPGASTGYQTYHRGPRHLRLLVPIPHWLGKLLYRHGVR